MGFVDADAVTDEELIFQQFINDESDQEDADDDSSDSDNERDARTRARWGNVAHTSRINHPLMCTRRPSALANLIRPVGTGVLFCCVPREMSFHGHDSFADNVALAPAADSDDDTGGAVDVDSGGERAHGDGVPSSETARKRPTAALAAAGKGPASTDEV